MSEAYFFATVDAINELSLPRSRIRPARECRVCWSAIEPGEQLRLYPDSLDDLCPPCCEMFVRVEIRHGCGEEATRTLCNALERLGRYMVPEGRLPVLVAARDRLAAEISTLNGASH